MRSATRISKLALLALGCAVASTACGGEAAEAEGPPATGVDATVARVDTVRVEIRSVGSLEADQRVEMAAEAAGRVASIPLREGSEVERGQTLLRLDQSKLAAAAEAAAATAVRSRREAENLETRVRRNRALLEDGAISEQAFDDLETEYDAARSRVEEAEARLSLARARLSDATIRAPFTGIVGARQVDVGGYVNAGDPLFTIVDDDPLEIEFRVPERYSDRLATEMPVELRVSSRPDRAFEGTVTFVSPVVDTESRTIRLKARVPNAGRELKAGQFADVILGLEQRPDAVVVPEAAIVPRGGRTLVFEVRDGTAARRQVETGERSRGQVEILSGISAGDTVVVAGHQRLGDGTPVHVTMVEPETLEMAPEASETTGPGTDSSAESEASGETDSSAASEAPAGA